MPQNATKHIRHISKVTPTNLTYKKYVHVMQIHDHIHIKSKFD